MNIKRHLFEFIVDHHTRWNYLPSRPEIRRFFSASGADVDLHLEQLAREGLLSLGADGESLALTSLCPATRSIELQNGFRRDDAAGSGHAPSAAAITVDLRAAGVHLDGDLFARVVSDDSMIDAGLRCGDIAIFRTGQPARGEIVAVEVAGELVLRRYLLIKDIPHLLAENPTRPELSAAFDIPAHGVLCCVISPCPGTPAGKTPWPAGKVNYTREDAADYGPTPAQPPATAPRAMPQEKAAADTQTTVAPRKKPLSVAAERRAAANNRRAWPEPPLGIALNEVGDAAYTVRRRT